ncbi:exosortase C-terminal domain/associated protein EpsI [Tunturiibacter gelidoferens]|uniref:EpsI family protein n=2 Tax=Tunturiibacter TaxID=3154218 RepID=A0A7Y9T3Y3_9BACT|nr:exosortase C-terminal domain/associated protein EpsI [Edaphobacter lichenicola]MBB5339830.1 EpsI family protein [Edaphobacter lichenicola]NYF50849.1 EpsI family protein [Edaphobacter lichenicola]
MRSPRFWLVIVLLASTAFILQSRGDADRIPISQPLSEMPEHFGGWTAQDVPLTDDTLAVLGKGDFLNRIYTGQPAVTTSSTTRLAPVSLFIGYFASQRTGQTMHSPQNCLPGAGWTFDSQRYTGLQDINGKQYKVGEYVISNGDIKQFVIYWYQAHGRSIPNEYRAKLYMVADAIRMNRTDGALVRVITQVLPSESLDSARERATQFTQLMAPNLPRFIPD